MHRGRLVANATQHGHGSLLMVPRDRHEGLSTGNQVPTGSRDNPAGVQGGGEIFARCFQFPIKTTSRLDRLPKCHIRAANDSRPASTKRRTADIHPALWDSCSEAQTQPSGVGKYAAIALTTPLPWCRRWCQALLPPCSSPRPIPAMPHARSAHYYSRREHRLILLPSERA
jgi:hypothetical protein